MGLVFFYFLNSPISNQALNPIKKCLIRINRKKTNNKSQITNNIQLPKTQIQKKDVSRIHKLFRPSIRKIDNVFANLGGHVA